MIGTARSHASCAFLILSLRLSSSRMIKSLLARRVTSRSSSLGIYGCISEFSSCFGFSPPRLKPLPMVDFISKSLSPICRAAACSCRMAASMLAGDMCAWRPIENAALLRFSFLPPFMDAMTSPTAPSTTLLKYASDIRFPVRRCT